jgi:cytochrome c-type biogenesis protein CcmH
VSRRLSARLSLGAVALAAAVIALGAAPAGAEVTPRASLTQIENEVMCVACHESLAVAQSPEAFSERAYIRQLIAQGLTEKQIVDDLVAQYGTAVLGKPPANGFNLLIYVLPPVLLAVGAVTLVLTIPRWKRRSRAVAGSQPALGPPLEPADAERLEQDLARHDV